MACPPWSAIFTSPSRSRARLSRGRENKALGLGDVLQNRKDRQESSASRSHRVRPSRSRPSSDDLPSVSLTSSTRSEWEGSDPGIRVTVCCPPCSRSPHGWEAHGRSACVMRNPRLVSSPLSRVSVALEGYVGIPASYATGAMRLGEIIHIVGRPRGRFGTVRPPRRVPRGPAYLPG